MHIKTLKLQNFRNYEDARFVLDPAVNLICGENGQGKTNLLEAAAACSTMRLFRTAQKKEGLRFGEDARNSRRRGVRTHSSCACRASGRWRSTKTA